MQTLSSQLVAFFPLLLGLLAFGLLVWRCERIGRRVAPDLASKPSSPGRASAPRGFNEWSRFLGERVLGIALIIAFLAGQRLVACVALIVLMAALGYYAYTLRIRPLIQRGATRPESFTLLFLMAVGVVSSGWFLFGFAGRVHVGG
jgi:hypothetical protein